MTKPVPVPEPGLAEPVHDGPFELHRVPKSLPHNFPPWAPIPQEHRGQVSVPAACRCHTAFKSFLCWGPAPSPKTALPRDFLPPPENSQAGSEDNNPRNNSTVCSRKLKQTNLSGQTALLSGQQPALLRETDKFNHHGCYCSPGLSVATNP